LCETCRESYEPDKATLSLVSEVFGLKDPSKMKYIHKLESDYFDETNNTEGSKSKGLNSTEGRIKLLWKANEGGCDDCLQTGYKGRVGLFEVINLSPSIQKLILSLASPSVLLAQATKEGTITILTDGLIKSLQGKISISEVFRLQQEHI
jgi:type II secretory ATPase GspE/PulE/Tfp pilus assembly ATPase PilB-like protein